jgi:hypothetical protein
MLRDFQSFRDQHFSDIHLKLPNCRPTWFHNKGGFVSFFLNRQHTAYFSHFSCYTIVTSQALQCRQLSFLSFILLISLPSLEWKVLLLLKECRNASPRCSRGLTQTTMAVFWSFYPPYTFNISSRRFRLPHFSWTLGHTSQQNL